MQILKGLGSDYDFCCFSIKKIGNFLVREVLVKIKCFLGGKYIKVIIFVQFQLWVFVSNFIGIGWLLYINK